MWSFKLTFELVMATIRSNSDTTTLWRLGLGAAIEHKSTTEDRGSKKAKVKDLKEILE